MTQDSWLSLQWSNKVIKINKIQYSMKPKDQIPGDADEIGVIFSFSPSATWILP